MWVNLNFEIYFLHIWGSTTENHKLDEPLTLLEDDGERVDDRLADGGGSGDLDCRIGDLA